VQLHENLHGEEQLFMIFLHFIIYPLNCLESKHTIVCRAAQENGGRANGVSILTGTTKSRFSRICHSVIPYPNGTKSTVELASTQGKPGFKF